MKSRDAGGWAVVGTLLLAGAALASGFFVASQGASVYLARFPWGCPDGAAVCVTTMKAAPRRPPS